MKNILKKIGIASAIVSLFIGITVFAVYINPNQIKPGSSGQVLTTVSGTTTWAAASGVGSATTTINGVSGPSFIFNTGTTGTTFNIATTTGTVTFNMPAQWNATSTGIFYNGGRVGIGTNNPDHALTVSGNGHFTQGLYVDNATQSTSTFIGKVVIGSTVLLATSTGNVGINILSPNYKLDVNGDVNIASGSHFKINGTNIGLSDITTVPVTIANGGTATTTAPAQDNLLIGNGTGYDLKKFTVSSNLTLATSGSQILLSSAPRSNYFLIESPTSTEDDAFMIFDATSTLTKVYAVNKSTGDTVTFNLCWAASRQTTQASAQCAFSSNWVVTATTTPSATTTLASTTIPAGSVMRFFTSAASSTQFNTTIYWTTP